MRTPNRRGQLESLHQMFGAHSHRSPPQVQRPARGASISVCPESIASIAFRTGVLLSPDFRHFRRCQIRRDVPIAAVSRSSKMEYSITSSALASNVAGTVVPSDLAVFRFTLNTSLVDCSTG